MRLVLLLLNIQRERCDERGSSTLCGHASGIDSLAVRAALFKSSDGAESWTRITDGLADDLDSMIWALVDHPMENRALFAGFCNVVRGQPADPEEPVISW